MTMISERKLEANRRNAQKSTGPRTEEGKARSARNNRTWGIYSNDTVIHALGETDEQFETFREAFYEEFLPATNLEVALLEDFIAAQWRLRRVRRAETGFYDSLCLDLYNKSLANNQGAHQPVSPAFDTWEESGRGANRLIGRAMSESTAFFSNLSRHETRLRNAAFKALRALEQRRSENSDCGVEPTDVEQALRPAMPTVESA